MRRIWRVRHPINVTATKSQQIDSSVIGRAQRGDLRALEILYLDFEAVVYTLALRLCGTEADADDVLQETFLEVSRSLRQFRSDGSFLGWLKRICLTKALMRLRRLNRIRLTEGPETSEDEPSQLPPFHLKIDLEAALGLLSDTSRIVVWLHDVEGYTHEEIAGELGGTESFSKSQLSRAHARLRKLLSNPKEAACNT